MSISGSIGLCAVILIFTYMFMFLGILHEKADCIKSATYQHYSVDDIVKLCGVEK